MLEVHPPQHAAHSWRDFFIHIATIVIGLLIAPGHLNPVLALTAVLCIAVAAGACGAINMWYDRDIDAIMRRTRNRPIPGGRIDPGSALGFDSRTLSTR